MRCHLDLSVTVPRWMTQNESTNRSKTSCFFWLRPQSDPGTLPSHGTTLSCSAKMKPRSLRALRRRPSQFTWSPSSLCFTLDPWGVLPEMHKWWTGHGLRSHLFLANSHTFLHVILSWHTILASFWHGQIEWQDVAPGLTWFGFFESLFGSYILAYIESTPPTFLSFVSSSRH